MLREIDKDGSWAITTTDKIISEDKNHFKGWSCSAGAKGLYIDHDGNIWKGLCFSAATDRFNHSGWSSYIKKESMKYFDGTRFDSDDYQYWYKNNNKIYADLSTKYKKQNKAYEKTIWGNDKKFYPGLVGNVYEGFFFPPNEVKNPVTCHFDTCGCGSDIWYPKTKTNSIIDHTLNLIDYADNKDNQTKQYEKIKKQKKNSINNLEALEPNYIIDYQVLWDMGRYCNYDCDYCWPSVHNNNASHLDYGIMQRTLGAIIYWIVNKANTPIQQTKKIKFFFSGGEPTLNPDFLKICGWLQNEKQLVSVSTNGTNTKEYYTKLAQVVNNFLFSIHFGSMEKFKIINEKKLLANINKVLTIHRLHNLRDKWVELKIMAPPGYVKHALKFYEMAINETSILDIGRDNREMGALTIVPIRTMGQSDTTAVYTDYEQELLKEFYANIIR